MVLTPFTESVVENAALDWFEALGYAVLPGAAIAPGEPGAERGSYADVVLRGRLRDAAAPGDPPAELARRDGRLTPAWKAPRPVKGTRQCLVVGHQACTGYNRGQAVAF